MPSKNESPFVDIAMKEAEKILKPPLRVLRGRPLLYELKVSDALELIDSEKIKSPRKGSSAFETDLCIFEEVSVGVEIPRVAIEFKTGITTHDVLTYSAKAERHKRIYPYLRYGMLASKEKHVPGRAFTHNETLDFFFAVGDLDLQQFKVQFTNLIDQEIRASKLLQSISYGKQYTRLFRNDPVASL